MTAPLALFVAFASGFLALSYELVWFRVISVTSGSSPAAFGLLLGAYLFGIANGSRRSGEYCRSHAAPGSQHGRLLASIMLASSVGAYLVVPIAARLAVVTWLAVLALIVVAATVLGAVLPLVSHLAIAADERAGQRLSYLYVANIVGSTTGSLVTGFVFFDRFALETTSTLLLAAGIAVSAVLFARSEAAPARRAKTLGALAAVVMLGFVTAPWTFDRVYERLLFKDNWTGLERFRTVVENRHGVIAVTPEGAVLGDGAFDGVINVSLHDDRNAIWHAFAVGALHPRPRRVLAIGLSSGPWVQVIANLPRVESVTVVEINPGYLSVIKESPVVASLLTNPKVNIVIDDGRRWLQRHPDERFDVLVMNTIYHWRANATNLLSQEFLETCRAHLAPGGIVYQNFTRSDDVLKTTASFFPNALRLDYYVAASDAPLTFDRARWEEVLTTTRINGATVLDARMPEDQRLLADLLRVADVPAGPSPSTPLETRDGVLARVAGAAIVRDDNMVTEWRTLLPRP